MVAFNAVSALFVNQYIMGAFHYGMKVRAAVCALIYRKVSFSTSYIRSGYNPRGQDCIKSNLLNQSFSF